MYISPQHSRDNKILNNREGREGLQISSRVPQGRCQSWARRAQGMSERDIWRKISALSFIFFPLNRWKVTFQAVWERIYLLWGFFLRRNPHPALELFYFIFLLQSLFYGFACRASGCMFPFLSITVLIFFRYGVVFGFFYIRPLRRRRRRIFSSSLRRFVPYWSVCCCSEVIYHFICNKLAVVGGEDSRVGLVPKLPPPQSC